MTLNESGEMYLENILILSHEKKIVRSIDIVERMALSKPAVSRAMTKLKAEKYIIMDKNGYIALTESGRRFAEKIYERHVLLADFIERLGVDEKTACEDACKIEHVISDETFDAVRKHVREKMQK